MSPSRLFPSRNPSPLQPNSPSEGFVNSKFDLLRCHRRIMHPYFKHRHVSLLLVLMSVFLVCCTSSDNAEELVRSSSTYGYSQKEVSDLQTRLRHTKFPQKASYVESLLKNQSGVGMLASVGDLLPNEEGILATYTLTYSLNDDWTLIVTQDHYATGKSPLGTPIVDAKAEIVRVKGRREN